MVSFDKPIPPANYRCSVCNGEQKGMIHTDGTFWCKACESWTRVYKGPPRPSICESCFNCVGYDRKKKRYLCAAHLYQMSDGTWYTSYHRPYRSKPKKNGRGYSYVHVSPMEMSPQWSCGTYEDLEGKTREQIKVEDPVRFYSTKRWDF